MLLNCVCVNVSLSVVDSFFLSSECCLLCAIGVIMFKTISSLPVSLFCFSPYITLSLIGNGYMKKDPPPPSLSPASLLSFFFSSFSLPLSFSLFLSFLSIYISPSLSLTVSLFLYTYLCLAHN